MLIQEIIEKAGELQCGEYQASSSYQKGVLTTK